MRRGFAFTLCLLLTACAQSGTSVTEGRDAVPERALLYPVGVNLLMSDRTLCVGHRPGRARDWTGQLSGCPHLLTYRVSGSDPSIPRLPLRRATARVDVTPRVEVAGRLFVAP